MKTVFVLSVLVVLAVASIEEEKVISLCKAETGLSLSDAEGYLKDSNEANDEKAAKYMVCYFKKTEVIDDEGHLDVEKAKENIKNYMKESGVDNDQDALNCIQEKDTAEETVLFIARCVEKRKSELIESK